MNEIEFRDPPPSISGRPSSVHWRAVAAALKANPGKWAFVGRYNSAVSNRIKKGTLAAFRPAGAFDATCRSLGEDQRMDMYVRYVGDQS